IAFILVGLLMSLLFKTLKLLIISLVPNVFPLIVAGGIMGFSGMAFNASTAIVFTIGFVIAVDDTIHFLSKFKIECENTVDFKDAIWNTINETGKAIIITTIILFFGFLVLLHSDLKGVFSQGVLICSMLIAALFGDLCIMPILLKKFIGNR
ncbi:MMPL family transporter, partial [Draconibacterium sp.]|nr:MMPL family transporter [Draconibacterium sp.]